MSLVLMASRQCKRLAPQLQRSTRSRLFSASDKPEAKPPPTMQNLALAAGLFGFCGFVFTYSMNAVGKSGGEADPLALLKAEAQEARQSLEQQHNRKLSQEEIEALESGMQGEYNENTKLRVAVAAPADIAQLEEEASLKAFRAKQEQDPGTKKKKPWWRFGF